MGYMRHHAIVVTGTDAAIEATHVKAVEFFGESVTPLTEKVVNGYRSFMVAPDGSKEWWPESDDGNSRREKMIAWLRETGGVDWAEVQFGDEENDNRVLAANGGVGTHDGALRSAG